MRSAGRRGDPAPHPRYRRLHWIRLTGTPSGRHPASARRATPRSRRGGRGALKRLAADHGPALDRARPLWETWAIEGLDGGERFALVTKIHHCMIDGASGVDLAHILLSPDALATEPASVPDFIPRPAPSRGQLWRDETARRIALPSEVVRQVRAFAQQVPDLREEIRVRGRALLNLLGTGTKADATPMNGKVSPHRRFDWFDVPLDGLKALRRALGCTINDLVLTAVTGAVREYLLYRGVRPDRTLFRISAPVSVRNEAERGRLGNRVSSWIVPLPIHEPDSAASSRRSCARRTLKQSRQALGVEMMMQVAEWTPSILLSLGARAMSGPVNTIVTNVPGPQFPLYLQGARLRALYPQAPLLDGMGLAVGLMSYDGRVHWGIISDPDLVPDADAFVERLGASLRRLADLAGLAPAAGEPGGDAPVPSVH
jgi:WS/DGAT/MGAT family acyltransferase